MARNDILVKLRLAGEEFSREFDRRFDEAIKDAEGKSESSGARAGGGFVKGFLGAAGIGALGAAIGKAISDAADLGLEIANTSRQFNIGAEELQVWRFAAQQAGVTASEFDSALNDLTRRIGEANSGNRDAQKSFVDLGIGFQTTAGEARNTDAVLRDLADRIAAIEDPSERVRAGTELLGEQFEYLYPLLLDGADGFDAAAAELDKFGGVLSREEIQNLQQTNAKIEQMKTVLSIKIAGIVAENSAAIIEFTTRLAEFGAAAINAANDWLTFRNAMLEYQAARRALPDDLSPSERREALAGLDARFGRRERVTGSALFGLFKTKEVEFRKDGEFDDISLYTDYNRAELARWLRPGGVAESVARAPRVSPAARRGGRGGGSSRQSASARAAEREAERAAKEAIRNEEQLRDAIARTLRVQRDSAEVERIRAEQGEVAAARAEAELSFLRQHPLAIHDTVEALATALDITKELTEEDEKRLQLLIDQGNIAQKTAGDAAAKKAQADLDREAARQAEEAQRRAEQEAEYFRRAQEDAIMDVADLYETAMRGGVDDLWEHFKDEGFRMIAEVAAQWTLAMLAGQPFDFNAAIGGALSRSPLSSIFFGSGFGAIPGAAANDNGLRYLPGTGNAGGGDLLPSGGAIPTIGGGFDATLRGGGANRLQDIAASLAFSQVGIALGGGSSLASQLLGSAGGFGGSSLFSSLAGKGGALSFLGGAAGPVGAVVGGLLGSLVGGLFGKGAAGAAIVGGSGSSLAVTGTRGGSGKRRDAASGSAGSLIDAIYQIADQLGADVNASAGKVSIGLRDDDYRVDPLGRGLTKIGDGAVNFGQDEKAAIEFAIRDLIKDGVLTGISQASQNLLSREGANLEEQIEKALLIEQIPRLLKERLDPLGAALDALYDRFKKVADAMREGGATAEQLAEAQKLYELEKADAIASVGAASETLKDFLKSLNAGSNSPLSLRQQYEEAQQQLQPFLDQIAEAEAARAEVDRLKAQGASAAEIEAAEKAARTAAAGIDQSGYTQASQLLLSISRQANASTGTFFSDFDRIRALTGQAIGFIDASAPSANDNRDPFSQAIAKNTEDAAYILTDQLDLIRRQNEILETISRRLGGGGGGFISDRRAFAV